MAIASSVTALTLLLLIGALAFLFRQSITRLFPIAPPDYFALTGVRAPLPLLDFNIDETKARPYRPFRWPYHQTMSAYRLSVYLVFSGIFGDLGLKSMDPDRWIELESTYRTRIQQRMQLYSQHGKKIVDCLPGAEAACRELMEMVIQFLCARYPRQFQLDSASGVFQNKILDVSSDTKTLPPLLFLLQHVPEDFLLTLPDEKSGMS
jgi:hypothetical protein